MVSRKTETEETKGTGRQVQDAEIHLVVTSYLSKGGNPTPNEATYKSGKPDKEKATRGEELE